MNKILKESYLTITINSHRLGRGAEIIAAQVTKFT